MKTAPNARTMAHSTELEDRLNRLLLNRPATDHDPMEVKKMFGGLAYLYAGKMSVGIIGDTLVARVPAASMEEALLRPGARPMDFTGKVMKEFVMVDPEGFRTDPEMEQWLDWGLQHARQALARQKPTRKP